MIDVPVEIAMSEPLFVNGQLSVYNAMKKMINTGKKYCIVLDEENNYIGVVTISDIIKHTVLEKKSPESTKIKEIATEIIITLSPNAPIEKALDLMKKYKVSKIPITKNGKIIGIITENELIGVLPYLIDPLKELVNFLINEINKELQNSENKNKTEINYRKEITTAVKRNKV
ncbi:Putative signal transduction protein with CBS domains [Methanocaldococcus lauensis]|uniref:Signal transduction protein with CBS domains n=1 Tax=Methanocaldococcus lauensis TaxID=2546128 RepID=A0A8D6PSZ3_9EURY|nr:CBS domain-containing protein [Methanocaldococcus lauensis]CAB3289656.1 Putative signal transduction protein with CBS domains [Methanocaldococcus lauensis]